MPPMYIGGVSPTMPGPMPIGPNTSDVSGSGSGAVGPTPLLPRRPFGGGGKPAVPFNSGGLSSNPAAIPSPPGVLPAQSVRPTGPSGGFDPQYLQNLATAIGGLFSRPGGSLSFNPLGNLSDISSPNLGFGNAPSPGLPSTLLQDAINNLVFMFNQPSTAAPGGSPVIGGGGGRDNGGNRRRLRLQ